MTCILRTCKKIGRCLKQCAESFPVAAKPGEQKYAQQQESCSYNQHYFGLPQSSWIFSAEIPEPEDECSERQRQEVKNSGLVACEHQR